MKPTSIQSGIAGEYLVAGELSRRGYIASITLRHTKGIDVLAASADASRSVGIQVKTNQGTYCKWLMNKSAETHCADNLFYVFVNLHHGGQPTFHVVPSNTVAAYLRESYARWLATSSRSGRQHRDTPMRQFEDKENRYLARWDLLGL